jgi:hypothetical protein
MNSLAALLRLRETIARDLENPSCEYCGDPATQKEHVIPRSHLRHLAECGRYRYQVTVFSCAECNMLAGNRVFRTFYAKRAYIHRRIRSRYKRILEVPPWTQEEIEALGWTLRTHILQAIKLKPLLQARIAWNSRPVFTVAPFSSDRGSGSGSVEPTAVKRGTQLG